jgi:hypothetical protein
MVAKKRTTNKKISRSRFAKRNTPPKAPSRKKTSPRRNTRTKVPTQQFFNNNEEIMAMAMTPSTPPSVDSVGEDSPSPTMGEYSPGISELPESIQQLENDLKEDPQPAYMNGVANFILLQCLFILIHFFMATPSYTFLVATTILNFIAFMFYTNGEFTDIFESYKVKTVLLTLISIGFGCYVLFDILFRGDKAREEDNWTMLQIIVIFTWLLFLQKFLEWIGFSILDNISPALRVLFDIAVAILFLICLIVAYMTESLPLKIMCAISALLCLYYFYGKIIKALVKEISEICVLPLFLLSVYFTWNIITQIDNIGKVMNNNNDSNWWPWIKNTAKNSANFALYAISLLFNSILLLGVLFVLNRFQSDMAQSIVTIYSSIIILVISYFLKKINII